MTTFVDAQVECTHCGKPLLGKFFQGYRCMRCQAVLHKACIAHRACIEIGSNGTGPGGGVAGGGGVDGGVGGVGGAGSGLKRVESSARFASSSSSSQVQEMQIQLQMEMENAPVEQQPWYAGPLSGKVATDRLENP